MEARRWSFGNIRSPNYYNEDFAILKSTTIHENHEIDFKVEYPQRVQSAHLRHLDGWVGDNNFGAPKRPKGSPTALGVFSSLYVINSDVPARPVPHEILLPSTPRQEDFS